MPEDDEDRCSYIPIALYAGDRKREANCGTTVFLSSMEKIHELPVGKQTPWKISK